MLQDEVNLPRTKKRKIDLYNERVKAIPIDIKKEQLRQGFISSMSIMKTLETFLPPIISKVTDFKTFIKYMIYSRLGKEDHMPYIKYHIGCWRCYQCL